MSVDVEVKPEAEAPASAPVQWHGVLAPVGVMSGDNRIFNEGAITFRDFPLPFKAMRKDLPGHDESVVVGNITNAWEEDGLIKGEGTFASNEDAEYFINLRKDDAMRGVSVDLDMAESQTEDMEGNKVDLFDPTLEFDPYAQFVERVTKGRVASATICAIPAFQEAYFALGPWAEVEAAMNPFPPADAPADKPDCSCDEADDNYDPECECPDEEDIIDQPASVSAAGGWGAPSQTIYDDLIETGETMRPAYTLVDNVDSLTASAAAHIPPMEWFQNPNLEALTPLTITDDGRVFGHAAGWGVCHIGLDKCVMAPKSPSQYAYFHTGALETDGGLIGVGQITMATGHASLSLSARPAVEHYDNTGTCVADIRCGEDKFGIWMAGQLRPGLTEKQIREFRAAAVSGDWREIGGQSEFVAALAVNVGGFPIPRLGFAASGTRVTAMTAAAIVMQDEREHDQEDSIKELIKAAVREVREEDKRVHRAGELRAELDKDNPERRAAVLAALGEDE